MLRWTWLALVISPMQVFAQDRPSADTQLSPPRSPTATLTGEPPTGPAPTPAQAPTTDVFAGRSVRAGQQHWIQLNASLLQPAAVRVGVKVWERENGSIWVEASGGSVLIQPLLGFGVRAQYSVRDFGPGDTLMFSPGLGAHLIPNYQYEHEGQNWTYFYGRYESLTQNKRNDLWFLTADADVSWLHDFSPRFGMELGWKFGLGFHVGGEIGKKYPRSLMFGKHVYPLLAVYSGFRF